MIIIDKNDYIWFCTSCLQEITEKERNTLSNCPSCWKEFKNIENSNFELFKEIEIEGIFNWDDLDAAKEWCNEAEIGFKWIKRLCHFEKYDWNKGIMYFKWSEQNIEELKKLFE